METYNNDPVLLTNTLSVHSYLLALAADGQDGNGVQLEKIGQLQCFQVPPRYRGKITEKRIMVSSSLKKITWYFLLGVLRVIVCLSKNILCQLFGVF